MRTGSASQHRWASLDARIAGATREERARTKIDLVVPSVLLDAGAGDRWTYVEDGVSHARSEGLALASYALFVEGGFAGDRVSLRTDAQGLARLDRDALSRAFQVTDANPLVGLEGRARTMRRLSVALEREQRVFGPDARAGNLFDALAARSERGVVRASDVVSLLLDAFANVLVGPIAMAGARLGDAWTFPSLGAGARSIVPFHKLTQWLALSLVEPLAEGGLRVDGCDELTGLAEYRNGGLFLDTGALAFRDLDAADRSHTCGDELVVEWRALTVALLDDLAPRLAALLGTADETPARGTIEALTWAAGREAAYERRRHGAPPLRLERDGTLF